MRIIYQDKNLTVIDKPAGVLTHPTEAKEKNTLVDFIIRKYPEIKKYIWADSLRPGIVHRLDKDTSGLLVVAKNPQTLKFLQEQFKTRQTEKTYLALVLGKVEPSKGKIIADIGRDQKNRCQQKTTSLVFSWTRGKTRPAETYYKVIKYYTYYMLHATYYMTLLEVKPKTGRLHQIRVHLKHAGWPIIGDPLYNTKESKKISAQLGSKRQFLHAYKLKISLPEGQKREFVSELPTELNKIINKLNSTS